MNIPNFASRHHAIRWSWFLIEAVHHPLIASSIADWSLCFPLLNISLSSSPFVCDVLIEFCAEEIQNVKCKMNNPIN
jgi:hypothetical protein